MSDQFTMRRVFIVEVSGVKNFDELQKIAIKHRGRYHGRNGHLFNSCFMFPTEKDAKAFVSETPNWPCFPA